LLHRGHDSSVVAAWSNLEDLPQVGRHVQSEAVARHVAVDREPDRRDLLRADPDAALRSLARRVDPEVGPGAKDNRLGLRHEALHLEPAGQRHDALAAAVTWH